MRKETVQRKCQSSHYVASFSGGWHASTENTNKVERYDMAKNAWDFVCPMHERRYRPGVTVSFEIYLEAFSKSNSKHFDFIGAERPHLRHGGRRGLGQVCASKKGDAVIFHFES